VAWRAPRGFWAYLILQVPDILLAGLVLLLLHKWMALSSAWGLGLFALWVVKDFAMYFLLQGAFRPPLTGPETLVGARAVAMEPLAPTGHVLLFGETWRAESLRPHNVIAPGTPVIVRAIRGLTLLVEGEHVNHPKDAQRDLP
jgi:membrane protein implicated in regulation of membrane protease activity